MVRLNIGTPFTIDAHAIQDFESYADGDVEDLSLGADINGQCSLGTSQPFQR